ncbi:MAG: hypothetical protein HOG49_18415, partial [Candidatus Scalindua sp.]|nr:hypothetical protein [Candidatus Scalindua sp.]
TESANYLTSYTESDPDYAASLLPGGVVATNTAGVSANMALIGTNGNNISTLQTESANYLTSYTESDPDYAASLLPGGVVATNTAGVSSNATDIGTLQTESDSHLTSTDITNVGSGLVITNLERTTLGTALQAGAGGLTSKYVPKWNDSGTALVDSSIYQNGGGNVGIGTTDTDGYKLSVADGLTVNSGLVNIFANDEEEAIPVPYGFVEVLGIGGDLTTKITLNGKTGTTTTNILEITGGADLSERFDIRKPVNIDGYFLQEEFSIKPGMVVGIDPENPGKLLISSEAYNRKVVGIISGAGGVQTGMMMGQKGSVADGQYPVALTGRVYCYVDATEHPVRAGDLLTTSGTPGHAMKVTEYAEAHGAILGKAMTSLDKGKGLVLVLVTLQ